MSAEPKANRLIAFLPLALFIALAGLFVWAMFGQRVDRHASALIGKPVPPDPVARYGRQNPRPRELQGARSYFERVCFMVRALPG